MRRFLGGIRRRLLPPRDLGQKGEAAAARHLVRSGYRIVARGHRSDFGELDLIAVEGKTIVFVEVKTRHSHDAGHPTEAVDEVKQQRLTRAALAYLKKHRLLEFPARFDVIAVTWPQGTRKPMIQHIQGAFEASGRGQMFS
jgi:putative endonuclease